MGLVAFLLAPLVAAEPHAQVSLTSSAIVGELAVGLVYGLSLALLNEMLLFAGQIVGLQFSFSLVNLIDPASSIQTPLLGDLFQLMGTLVLITAGLDRVLLASMLRSFRVAPLGTYAFDFTASDGDCARGGRSVSGRSRTGRTSAGGNPAGGICDRASGKVEPPVAGDVLTVPAEDADRIRDPDRRLGTLAAIYRGALCRIAQHG